MSMAGSSDSTGMSAMPADIDSHGDEWEEEDETSTYESLYDIRRDSCQHPKDDSASCCSSSLIDAIDHGDEIRKLALQEAAIRKCCEEDIEKYLRESEEEHQQQHVNVHSEEADEKAGGVSSNEEVEETTQQQAPQPLTDPETLPDLPLEIGDHVFQWRSFVGIPGVFQHHGIVMDIGRDENGEMELSIADFSCALRTPSDNKPSKNDAQKSIQPTNSIDMLTGQSEDSASFSSIHPHGILRVYNSSSKDPKWHKVLYRASVWKTSLWRSGTCTCVDSDPPAKVLARAYFLLENPQVLPSYHVFKSNCECVSLWCKTGFWSTLQASSLLSLTAAGQLKSTATIAAWAASQTTTVTAPAAGIWGLLGYTTSTQVSLLTTQPHLMPLLAAYGVVTAGGPTLALWNAQSFWKKTSERLEEAFWKHALKDPDFFAQSLFHWSEKHKAFER